MTANPDPTKAAREEAERIRRDALADADRIRESAREQARRILDHPRQALKKALDHLDQSNADPKNRSTPDSPTPRPRKKSRGDC